jgi:hypothetical protein
VGIADCSVESDLTTTFNKFSTLTSRYRISPSTSVMQQGVVPKTCLAFELRSDQKDPDLSNFKVIPDQDFAHFNFYLTHIFGEELVRAWLTLWETTVRTDPEMLTDKIFDSLYGPSENVSNPSTSHTALITLLDSDLPDEAPKGRKRRLLGRIRKQMGDLCLFAGSPVDAMNQYRQALEISRACSDWEWVGSALESMASAILSVRDASGLDHLSQLEVLEITNRLTEARTCYSRRSRANYLEAENLLRNAIFFQQQDKRIEMSELLSKCQEVVETIDPSNLHARIRLYSAIALAYRNTNFTRKYAFFIQLICRLCIASEVPPSRSHQLLEQVAPEYDITVNSLIHVATSKNAPKTRREKMISSGASWSKLQASILSLLIDLSSSSGDTIQSIKYLVYMMRQVAPELLHASHIEPSIFAPNKTDWGLKLKQLSMTMPPPLDTSEGDPLRLGFGMLRRWKPLKDQSMYMHISRSVSDPLFLYRPNRKAKEAIAASASHVFCWSGHTIYFEVSLRNSLLQKAILEDVRITFYPIVLTTVEPRPGDIRTEVDWMPQLSLEAMVQTSAQIVVEPGETVTVKLSATIPTLYGKSSISDNINDSNVLDAILKDSRCKILLAPDSLVYSMFNCPFAEPMISKFNTLPKNILLDCLHYITNVPTVSVEDSSHPWLSYTTVARDVEPIIALPSTRSYPTEIKTTNMSIIQDVTTNVDPSISSSSIISSSRTPTVGVGKSISNLTTAVSQLRGETFLTTLVLRNESVYPVDDFGLTIQENGENLSHTKLSQVLVGSTNAIYDIISKALPLNQGETIQIPLEFVAPGLGLVQVSFLMEYRNNGSADNIWRKLRMDYSFKVVESLKPLKLEVSSGLESSLDVLDRSMPQNVIIVPDEGAMDFDLSTKEMIEEEQYILVQVALQNKTMLSFHIVKDDQVAATLTSHHNAFVLDPWAIKQFSLALHRQTFVDRMCYAARQLISTGTIKGKNAPMMAYQQVCKEFLTKHLKLSWRSYGNRSGIIHMDSSLIDDSVLSKLTPQRWTTKLGFETAKAVAVSPQFTPETPGTASFILKANQIYKLNATVKFLNPSIQESIHRIETTSKGSEAIPTSSSSETTATTTTTLPTYFSAICRAHHIGNSARMVSWIGKNQNIVLASLNGDDEYAGLHIPILFHIPGTYTITTRVHHNEVESTEEHWSRDISIVVTR